MTPASHGVVMPGRNSYDDEAQTWTLAALDFSENYDDYIAAIAVFREVARYKDLPGEDGFLIYEFLFGDKHIVAALRIEMDVSQFLDEGDAEPLVPEADVAMEALMAEGAASAG